jgi:hypothetical protein
MMKNRIANEIKYNKILPKHTTPRHEAYTPRPFTRNHPRTRDHLPIQTLTAARKAASSTNFYHQSEHGRDDQRSPTSCPPSAAPPGTAVPRVRHPGRDESRAQNPQTATSPII